MCRKHFKEGVFFLRRSANFREVFVQHTEAHALPFEPRTRLHRSSQPVAEKSLHIEKRILSHWRLEWHARVATSTPELGEIQLPTAYMREGDPGRHITRKCHAIQLALAFLCQCGRPLKRIKLVASQRKFPLLELYVELAQ